MIHSRRRRTLVRAPGRPYRPYAPSGNFPSRRNTLAIIAAAFFVLGALLVAQKFTGTHNVQGNIQSADEPAAHASPNSAGTPTQPVTPAEEEQAIAETAAAAAPVVQADTAAEITRGNAAKQQVIFTFDAGSGAQSIDSILTALKRHSVTATFFLTGVWAEKNEGAVRAIAEGNHEIFNHSYSHPHFPALSDEEIRVELQQAEEAIARITGVSTKPYFRAPYGDRTSHVIEVASAAGYRSVFWTVDALDWKEAEGMTAVEVEERILSRLAPGTIYLMHVGDTLTGTVLDRILGNIEEAGYSVVPLTEGLK